MSTQSINDRIAQLQSQITNLKVQKQDATPLITEMKSLKVQLAELKKAGAGAGATDGVGAGGFQLKVPKVVKRQGWT